MTREALPAYSPVEAAPPAFDEATADNQSLNQDSETSRFMTAEEEKSQLALSVNGEHVSNADEGSILRTPASSTYNELGRIALVRGVQVPTKTRLISSGFQYPESLQHHSITTEDWARFTSEITSAAKMRPNDWAITIASGLGAGAASGPLLHWFALIPAIMVGHQVRRIRETRNLKAALASASGRVDLEASLLKWNEEFFAPRGVLVRLELPGESTWDMSQMDLAQAKKGCCKSAYSRGKKSEEKAEKALLKEQKRATRRGRIVIIPINRQSILPLVERGVTDVAESKSEV